MDREIELRSGRELKAIARKLRKMDDKELKKLFTKELRKAARPMVPAVRASIRRLPSKRPYRADGLRGRMSKATKLEVKTAGKNAGVRMRVDGRKMPNHARSLQMYMEGTKKPWRHPVYGNRNVWVQQPAHPYFYRVMNAMGPLTRLAVNRVLDEVTRKIT